MSGLCPVCPLPAHHRGPHDHGKRPLPRMGTVAINNAIGDPPAQPSAVEVSREVRLLATAEVSDRLVRNALMVAHGIHADVAQTLIDTGHPWAPEMRRALEGFVNDVSTLSAGLSHPSVDPILGLHQCEIRASTMRCVHCGLLYRRAEGEAIAYDIPVAAPQDVPLVVPPTEVESRETPDPIFGFHQCEINASTLRCRLCGLQYVQASNESASSAANPAETLTDAELRELAERGSVEYSLANYDAPGSCVTRDEYLMARCIQQLRAKHAPQNSLSGTAPRDER